jgi:hypothetical protein
MEDFDLVLRFRSIIAGKQQDPLFNMRETNMQLASMPLDSIVVSTATIVMFCILILALAWGVHQSG